MGNEKRLKLAVILSLRYIFPAYSRNRDPICPQPPVGGSIDHAGNRAGYIFHLGHYFETNPLPGSSHICTLMLMGLRGSSLGGEPEMKLNIHLTHAFLLVAVMTLVPASAYALRMSGGGHPRSQTYHDRTPRVHSHGSHPRRG
jgi:hypothetical protein